MNRKSITLSVILVLMVVFTAFTSVNASTITVVPGTSDLWLAGMPDGSTASSGDVAPAQSPVLVAGLSLTAGASLVFSATGLTDHCTGGACGYAGPGGDFGEGSYGHLDGAQNGISSLVAPIDSLIGVFLGSSQPDLSPAPGTLNFGTSGSLDFASLSPELQQAFYIGDGLRNDGVTVQTFIVPAGATRLYLGTMDGFGWYNNVGEFTVTTEKCSAAPEPATLLLLGLGLLGIIPLKKRVR